MFNKMSISGLSQRKHTQSNKGKLCNMSTVITTGTCLRDEIFMETHKEDVISDCFNGSPQLPKETSIIIPISPMRKPNPKRSNNITKV